MAEVRILRGACVPSLELGGRDQVAHCPRLATGASHRHPTPCVWMRHQAPPYLARAGLKHAVPHSPRVSESVSPARLTGGATTRLRGREKFKSFPFSSEKSAEKFLLRALTHEECCKEGITSRLEKCGLPLKHCTKQRSGRKSVTSLLSRKSRRR